MKWLSASLLTLLLLGCNANKWYPQNSKRFKNYNFSLDTEKINKTDRLLSIGQHCSFSTPNRLISPTGYSINARNFDYYNSYILNDEKVHTEGPLILDVYKCKFSPFGRYNQFTRKNVSTDSFYLPDQLLVHVNNNEMELTGGDTFTWKRVVDSKFLLLQVTNEVFNTQQYLIKDNGQFVLPNSLLPTYANKRVTISFTRAYEKIIKCSDGSTAYLSSFTWSSGEFITKKATP